MSEISHDAIAPAAMVLRHAIERHGGFLGEDTANRWARDVIEAALPFVRHQIAAEIKTEAERWYELGYDDDGAWIAAVKIAETGSAGGTR